MPRPDELVTDLEAVLAEYDLKPEVSLEPADPGAPTPDLMIDGETVMAGPSSRQSLRRAVQKQISEW